MKERKVLSYRDLEKGKNPGRQKFKRFATVRRKEKGMDRQSAGGKYVKVTGDQVARGLENLTVGSIILIESLKPQIQTENRE